MAKKTKISDQEAQLLDRISFQEKDRANNLVALYCLFFSVPTVVDALATARPIKSGRKLVHSGSLSIDASKRAYLQLCFSLFSFFEMTLKTKIKRQERRIRDLRRDKELLEKLMLSLKGSRAE